MEPQILQGFRDFLPEAMERRNFLMARLTGVFEAFGFRPLQTPALEYYEILAGKYGEEGSRLMYHFTDNGSRHVGLRYDLTVPLARVIAMHGDLPRPFRRYQIAPVWRAESPQKGRFREFYQCDVDVVGSPSMLVDAELLSILGMGMQAIGLKEFVIRVNNRKLLDAATQLLGLGSEHAGQLCRSLDKLDKVHADAVSKELVEAGFPADTLSRLLDIFGPPSLALERLAHLERTLGNISTGAEGTRELRQVVELALGAGVDVRHLIVEPTLARGLDYYTATIFEVVLPSLKIGSVAGGGRYDGLIGQMGGKAGVPAAGVSFGLDRLLVALEELDLLPKEHTRGPQVLVTVFDEASRGPALALASELRRAGVRTEISYEAGKLGKQFKHADKIGAVLTVVEGPDERATGQATVKDLRSGQQKTIARAQLVEFVQQALGS